MYNISIDNCPYPATSLRILLKHLHPQVLRRARERAPKDRMLPGSDASGHYGDRFWAEVARNVPGRTMTECLDGYIASHYSTVSRFSARPP